MESELLGWLRNRLPDHPQLRLGPGDDAALLRLVHGSEFLATCDLLTDQVDFDLSAVDPRRVGHKALAVNLSDIAAMAGRPTAAIIALALPRRGGKELAIQLYEGLLPLAERYQVAIAGGDINSWDGPLVISITLLGEPTARGPLCRAGAKPGDLIVVTGAFGGSILGHHLDFEPRIHEALLLHTRFEVHAGIDVSDGLAMDLGRLTDESRCGAVLRTDQAPIAEDAHRLSRQRNDALTPLDHALGDGEDFELILAVPPGEARRIISEQPLETPLTIVGEFIAEPGLWRDSGDGERRPLARHGYEHRLDS